MKKPYRAIDVARFIIKESNDKGRVISNLKLQKLLYFIQASFLVNNPDEPCFSDNIEAWDFGPVVPNVYREYKMFGANHINHTSEYVKIDDDNFWNSELEYYDDNIIDKCDKKIIRDVLDAFSNYTASQLVEITHNQDPWVDTYEKYSNNIISNEKILKYFNGEN
ncbi:MAG: Panacea domain-containing protein [Peptoanaerobacter stomatis]|uniref:Panacea domain-containing protein n=1 Tax=Peptoanaerobacter stomatis TaxID=796937 RepID=UPI003F9EE01E